MSRARRILIKSIAAATAFGVVFASAATLGNVNTGQLGAGNATVGSCQQGGVDTAFSPTWDDTASRFEVSKVTVSRVDGVCDGQNLQVTLTKGTGERLGSGTVVVSGIAQEAEGALDVTLDAPRPAATDVAGIHVAIGR